MEVLHFLFSTFPSRWTSITRKSLPRWEGGANMCHTQPMSLLVASGDRVSGSQSSVPPGALPLEGGAYPPREALSRWKVGQGPDGLQSHFTADVPGCSHSEAILPAQPPFPLCPQFSCQINLSSFPKYFISIYQLYRIICSILTCSDLMYFKYTHSLPITIFLSPSSSH